MLKKLAVCLSAMASLTAAACTIDVQGEGTSRGVVVHEQKRFAVTGTPDLFLRTFDGSIELRAWDRDEILVDIERRAESMSRARDIEVETVSEGGSVRIEAKPPRRSGDFIHFGISTAPSVRLTVTVPRKLNVEARTGDGAIYASAITGRMELRTGDGSVRLQRVTGDITVSTGDGSVSARELAGLVNVVTGDGSVEMSGQFEEVRARTGDGAIGIDVLPGSTMRRRWNVSTGDGSVMMRLPAEFDADLDAHTGDGTIVTSGVEVTPRPQNPDQRRRNVRGRIGAGGEELTVRTGDGSINIVAK